MTGGAPVPTALSEGYRRATGVPLTNAWGMTETSGSGPVSTLRRAEQTVADDEQARLRTSAGRMTFGIEARIVDEAGSALPWDGASSGELQCRGPWVTSTYYNDSRGRESFTADGWLRTGDVAHVDPEGYLFLVDRTKDLVKSGGEWISSAELENEIMAHPAVLEAAVIGVAHPKWTERPLACVVLKEGESATKEDILSFLDGRVAKWWMPDDVVFIDTIPKTSTGKFSKKDLRVQFKDFELPTA